MKKYILMFIIFLLAVFVYINVNAEEIVIPDSAIRVRVIANSNSIKDQKMKVMVKKYVSDYIYPKIVSANNIEEARDIINDNLDNLNRGIDDLFDNSNYDMKFDINYGDNYFPDKEYKGIKYKEGKYESLVVTIGSGLGDNWWCVLFPPLCLLEGEERDSNDTEYSFFVKDILKKIFE